ncbi:MAG TPA: zf-HC2 domain-containing protein [Candidatus Saccharimonadales bacterium]|nr:zf-HC2 domain-containing protein [Candidatus Saccharimonadales bacterium]
MSKGSGHCDLERLQDLFDGRLTGGEAAAARAHMDGCDACRAAFEDWGTLRRMLAAARGELQGQDGTGLWDPIAWQVRGARRRGVAWLRVGAVAAGLAVAATVWQLLSTAPSSQPASWDLLTLQAPEASRQWVAYHLPLPEDQFASATSQEGTQ